MVRVCCEKPKSIGCNVLCINQYIGHTIILLPALFYGNIKANFKVIINYSFIYIKLKYISTN